MGRNQYLNEVAQIFHTASADKAASFNIVEVVTHMFNQANQKYGKIGMDFIMRTLFTFSSLTIASIRRPSQCSQWHLQAL